MTEETKVKGNALRRGVTAVIVLAVVFALLIVGYFAILRPYLNEDDGGEAAPVEMLWSHEVASINNRMLIYEHIPRDEISKIEVHNPDNEKFGSEYVDWGFYRYTGADDEENGMVNNAFYLTGYEYAPYDETAFANMITAAGYTLATSRVEDHCTDFSKYGLDYATPEEAFSVTITALDGRSYTYYIGDKLPSGSGYYVRCVNNDTLLSTGEEMQRDSVYVLPPTNLVASALLTPMDMVDPFLTFPVDVNTLALFDQFAIWRNEEKYFSPKLDENGNQVYEDGKPVTQWKPMVHMRPITNKKDPFSLFAGMCTYYAVVPSGYYSTGAFENLIGDFGEFKGEEVVALGQMMTDEDGEEYIGFTEETFEKYGLLDYRYSLYYEYTDIDNYVYFSKKQPDGYYYAYSLNFNIIAKVPEETVYFLEWTPEAFIQRQIVDLKIDNCASISIEGSYTDLGVLNPDRKGEVSINETFELTNTGSDLLVTDSAGNQIDTKNFRQFYLLLMNRSVREEVSEEAIAEAMKNEPMTTLTVRTKKTTVYKTDEAGNTTTKVDYERESVSKIYRFYKLTSGRVLCTIESIDANGKSLGEEGTFYMITARVEEILSAAVDLQEGIAIDTKVRY